jgi:hypothetical protein
MSSRVTRWWNSSNSTNAPGPWSTFTAYSASPSTTTIQSRSVRVVVGASSHVAAGATTASRPTHQSSGAAATPDRARVYADATATSPAAAETAIAGSGPRRRATATSASGSVRA